MGANSTQAGGVLTFFIGFILIAGAGAGGGVLSFIAGLLLIGVSVFLFRKAKPWETQND